MRRRPPSAPLAASPPRFAFSLIELLVVVAIITILAAIAIPNFLEAQTRAKVARAVADLRSLHTAVAQYVVDYDEPPPRNPTIANPEVGVPASADTVIFPCYQNRSIHLSVLTTPLAYVTEIPLDVFEQKIDPPNNTLEYFDPQTVAQMIAQARDIGTEAGIEERGFVLISVGPDGLFGHSDANYGSFCPEPYPQETPDSQRTWDRFYDPINGTKSYGNIYRFVGWPNNQTTFDPNL